METTQIMRKRTQAFTLVELLVVIGIIAVLVSMLLPALSAARRQSNASKCLSNMRQIGTAYFMYANDNKGTWPVSVWRNSASQWYNNYFFETDNPANYATQSQRNWYWHMFIQKYVNSKIARNTATAGDRDYIQKNNILWGCPNWRPWEDSSFTGGTNIDEVGYGMNWCPTYRPDFPSIANPDSPGIAGIDAVNTSLSNEPSWDHRAYRQTSGANKPGRFFKQVEWKEPSQRGLICDSEYFSPALDLAPQADGYPQPQPNHVYQYYGPYNLDFFRHGKPGKGITSGGKPAFEMSSGKPGINMLYCDGHAETLTKYGDVYMALRRKYK